MSKHGPNTHAIYMHILSNWKLVSNCFATHLRYTLRGRPRVNWNFLIWPYPNHDMGSKNESQNYNLFSQFWSNFGILRPCWAILGASWVIWGNPGPFWGHLGTLFGVTWGYLGLFKAILRHLGRILGSRAFWKPLHRHLGPFWAPFWDPKFDIF